MSSWGNHDNAANAPYWAINSTLVSVDNQPVGTRPTAANVALLYGNTTPDVYTTNETIGLFMVTASETSSGGGGLDAVSIIQGGSGYVEAPGVTVTNSDGGSGSSASASATISGGVVTQVAVTANGSGYTAPPTITMQVPGLTVGTSQVNTTTHIITYTGYNQANGAALLYKWNGSSNIGGLTNANTYYVVPVDANNFRLATTPANAANNTTINLSSQGGNGQFFVIVNGVRATADGILGLGEPSNNPNSNTGYTTVPHAGWNLKTVGAGGRAGRVHYETLVALANPQS